MLTLHTQKPKFCDRKLIDGINFITGSWLWGLKARSAFHRAVVKIPGHSDT